MFFFPFILLILSLAEGGVENDLDYLRLLDDRLMYQIAYKSASELPENIESSREKLIQITSPDQEQYQCLIPTVNTYSKKRIESYVGPSPAELLQPIYDEKICSYKFESYWNYELCHGQYVLQYHEEKETKSRTNFFLGNFVSVSAVTEARNFDQLSPPTKKIGDEMRAYYPVTYIHGTNCDITGKPRQTAVLYVCDEDARQNIYSFTEISSCQYELIVLSSELCAHPAFQVIPHKEHEISCFPMDRLPGEDPKPKALLKVEEETENQFMQEYALFKDTSTAKTAQQIFSKLFQVEENVIEDGFNQLNAIIESFKKAAQENAAAAQSGQTSKPTSRFSLASKEQQQMAKKTSPPPQMAQMSEMEKVVHGFWRGTVCLNGGTGWWKYEVCYGKTVTQFHHEVGKPRQNILLGVFDREVHKAWATEHPDKAVERNSEGKVLQVTNLYTRGEICEQTNAHRSCELRMRCRNDIAAQKVFIYMLEPATCQYFVVLESPLFCDALQKVDKFGLFPEGTLVENSMAAPQGEEEGGQSAKEEEKPQISHLIFEERKIVEGEDGEVEGNNEDKNVVKRKTKVEIGLINQEEIMRIVQNLVQGMNDGQVTVDMTKIKIPLTGGGDSEEEEEKENAAPADGGNEPKKEGKNAGQIGAAQNAEESTENNSADERKSTQKRKLGNDGGEL